MALLIYNEDAGFWVGIGGAGTRGEEILQVRVGLGYRVGDGSRGSAPCQS